MTKLKNIGIKMNEDQNIETYIVFKTCLYFNATSYGKILIGYPTPMINLITSPRSYMH